MDVTKIIFSLALGALLYYFVVARPKIVEKKRIDAELESMAGGDRVLTKGGIIGTILGFYEDQVELQVSEAGTVRVLRSYVARVMEKASASAAAA